jgi:hypothetical protein
MRKSEIYKKSVINMGTKTYNKMPRFLKEVGDNTALCNKLKLFLLLHSFYSVKEFIAS